MVKKSTSSSETYTDPELRDEVKEDLKKSNKGGHPGQWSGRNGIDIPLFANSNAINGSGYKKKGGGWKVQKDKRQNIFKLAIQIRRKIRKTMAPA
jgi:hypothetical protein